MNKFQNAWLLLEKLMDSTLDSIYFKDRDSRFIMLNEACATKHGFASSEDGIGKTDFDTFSDEHAKKAFADEQRIIATGCPLIGIEEKETWTDGHVSWCSSSKMPLIDNDGSVFGILGISRDITDRKKAELEARRCSEEVNRIKERMEDDVRMAARLQNTFFPRSYPTFPHNASESESCIQFNHCHHASEMVSGDFCTVRRLSEHEAGIFICDVMGHGVRAALGTALIYAIFEDLASQTTDPGILMTQMNRMLLPMLHQEDEILFASACYVMFNATTGLLRCANAGHPMPILISTAAKTATWLMNDPSTRGCALGIAEHVTYQTATKKLSLGDKVLLYTDGLYEVEREDGEEFGEQRLLSAVMNMTEAPLSDLVDSLIDEACHFAHADHLTDDVCMIAFQYSYPQS